MAGENVNISAAWRMLMDVPNPPPFANVYVYGQLMFEDTRDYNFTANRVSTSFEDAHIWCVCLFRDAIYGVLL